VALAPGDSLLIKQAPEWRQGESITLAGEVMFPGTYAIRRGETLRSVIERAGGLTELANPSGSIFTRAELRELEQREVSRLAERLRRDLASSALQNSQSAALAGAGGAAAALLPLAQQLLGQLENVKPVGRLVIDLDRVLRGSLGSRDDIVLRAGDQLIVPRFRQEVSVIGEVQNVTSHLHRSGFKAKDYIALSGGLRGKSDEDRIFVVKPDGTVVLAKQGWFNPLSSGVNIQPGDTIVVPLDTESLSTLGQIQLWQAVTGIIYNSAVAVAAIQGL
jgi:polysaccharide export outer membrane protein